ncbi:hypothetical protein D3C80_1461350 [compost metagenome]
MHMRPVIALFTPLPFYFAVVINWCAPNVKAKRLVKHFYPMLGHGDKRTIIRIEDMSEVKAFNDELILPLNNFDFVISNNLCFFRQSFHRKLKLLEGHFMASWSKLLIFFQSTGYG